MDVRARRSGLTRAPPRPVPPAPPCPRQAGRYEAHSPPPPPAPRPARSPPRPRPAPAPPPPHPRTRRVGRLTLDLLAREAFGDGKPLNLNPREFALIWRLADSIDQFVSKQALIYDVWRMGFVPETNSVAVHMSRLRRKLAFVGFAGIIEHPPSGGDRRHG